MRYTAYRRKPEEGFYVLHDTHQGMIYAISENKEYVELYRNQFECCKNNAQIAHVVDKQKMNSIYRMYYDTYFLEEFKDGLVLTSKEVIYYTKLLTKVYDDMKTMISQLLLNERLLNLTSDELITSRNAFTMYYSKCKSLQEFINMIDVNLFKNEYLIEPIAVKDLSALDDWYRRKMLDSRE